jgi:serine/threonine protein kinase
MILAGERASEDEIRRFLREAAAAAKLRHPNIVTVHELDVHEGIYYYTMEYLGGQDLGRLIDEGGMEPRRAVIIALKVARALAHAHGRGIIHRDLKPGNIIIGESDEPVLTDFGLAFDLRQAPDGAAPLAAGTPGYMAPEQVTGQHDRIGPATDIYSLGAVFYEMLTGRPPFTAATAKELFELVLDGEPEDPCRLRPGLDSDLAAIGMRCLRKKPEERYRSAAELAEVLVAWLSSHPKAGRP